MIHVFNSPTSLDTNATVLDVIALHIRSQNAGVILRKFAQVTHFESFEASPHAAKVIETKGKLLCSYPGSVVAVPHDVVDDCTFREELASFLAQMNIDALNSTVNSGGRLATGMEDMDSAHPRYITQLLTGILLGVGEMAEVTRIHKTTS